MTLFAILIFGLLLVGALAVMIPLFSFTLTLDKPVDCTLGHDCFIQNFVDLDASEKAVDYQCRHLTYDGHKGTDFRLINNAHMRDGVNVLATTDGTVKGIREGMDDVGLHRIAPDQLKDRECGNGVLLEHKGGYQTQYCHLKKGSIAVKEGDTVKTGDVLGQIGLSGMTEFPHLHLEVRDKDGQIIDPFAGLVKNAQCGKAGKNLWRIATRKEMTYLGTGLLQAGFSETSPTAKAARDGRYDEITLTPDSDGIIFWAEAFGTELGDTVLMRLYDPTGEQMVNHSDKIEANKAISFNYIGKRRQEALWPSGEYTGHYILKRKKGEAMETVIDRQYHLRIEGDKAEEKPTTLPADQISPD